MSRLAGGAMRLPMAWTRSRAAALATTLILHVAAILWLAALRFDLPERVLQNLEFLWPTLPPSEPAELPTPPPADLDSAAREDADAGPPGRETKTETVAPGGFPPDAEGWSRLAKDAARRLTAPSAIQPFGEVPKGPPARPSDAYPPSIFDKPLPRVGQTVTTAEGETIIWVSDYCYVSVQSRSLTQQDIHAARNGVRTCILAQFGGEKEARGDLFDTIQRPPLPQEPGCNREGIGLSCSR